MSFIVFICILLCVLHNEKELEKKVEKQEKRGLIICRVSTSEQKRGTSLDTQENWGINTEIKMDVKNACEPIKMDISGEQFPKEFYDKIMDLIRKEKITHIFVYSLDRLSRSFSYGVRLVQSLWDNNVIIVTSTMIPNKDKHIDRIQVWLSLLFAEIEHGGIEEKTRRGIIHKLKQGLYMRGKPPWGFEIVDGKLRLLPGFKEIISFIFETFVLTENYAETARITNKKYVGIYNSSLNDKKITAIVTDLKYTGFFGFDGIMIGDFASDNKPHKEMAAIDLVTYYRAQSIVEKKKPDKSKKSNHIPLIEEWVKIYGPEYVYDKIDYSPHCPQCHSKDITKNGSQTVNGTRVGLFYCKKENYFFRSPTAAQIKEFHSLNPLRCMSCGTVDRFKVSDSQLTNFIEIVCRECGYQALIKRKDNLFRVNDSNNILLKNKKAKTREGDNLDKNCRLTEFSERL